MTESNRPESKNRRYELQPVNSYRIVFCRRLCSLYFHRLTYLPWNTIADLMEIAVCPGLLTVTAPVMPGVDSRQG